MDRTKLAIWGINDIIWNVIKNTIDPETAEVVLFIDSSLEKQGIYFENIPIVAPSMEMLGRENVDVYLITALSAYENIRKTLLSWGEKSEKIQPFITDEICKYNLGALDEVDKGFIKEAYFEPEKREDLVKKYRDNYIQYSQSIYTGNADWINQGTLISHACGGIVEDRKVTYSNSKEAFDYTAKSKFRLMECDVRRTKNNELVLGHDFHRLYEAREKQYTTMSLEELLRGLNKYKALHCLIDVQWDIYDDYKAVITGIDRILLFITKDEKERANLRSRIVMEVYDEETIKLANQNNFNMFFTQYRNPNKMDYLSIANLCCKYGIGAVGIGVNNVDERQIRICSKKGIKIFVFSTDSIEEYSRLRKMGIAGIFTNYLRPMDI